MTSWKSISWKALALLTAVCLQSPIWAQRASGDSDSYPDASKSHADVEPPRLMRGGIMQQLRSVTESVMGTGGDDKPSANQAKSKLPTPPPLGAARRPLENRGRSYAPSDFSDPQSSSDATMPGQRSDGKGWAGQFLIPNYNLRNQVGTRPLRNGLDARHAATSNNAGNSTSDTGSPAGEHQPSAAQAEGKKLPAGARSQIAGARVPAAPGSSQSASVAPAQRRVYLGQSSAVDAELADDVPEVPENQQLAPVTRQADSRQADSRSKSPNSNSEPTNLRLNDEAVDEPEEVLVSHVPDVPYVPRKPLPKRPRSTTNSQPGRAQSTAGSASNKVKSSDTTPTKIATQPVPITIPSATNQSSPTGSATLPSMPTPSLPTPFPTGVPSTPKQPIAPLPPPTLPSVPSLELSSKLPSPPPTTASSQSQSVTALPPPPTKPTQDAQAETTVREYASTASPQADLMPPSLPPVPSKPLPSTAKVPAQTVSTPASTSHSSVTKLPSAQTKPSTTTPSDLPTGSLPSPTLPSPTASLPTASLPAASLPAASLPAASFPTALPSPSQLTTSPTVQTKSMAVAPILPNAVEQNFHATANGDDRLRAPGANERLHMEIPHIAVKLLGPGDLTAGTPTSYELQVQNSDRLALSGLILRMEVPAGVDVVPSAGAGNSAEIEKAEDGATMLTWSVAQVAAGGTARLPMQLNANAPRNFAVAIEWTILPQSGFEEITVKQADLQIALEGPVEVERNLPNAYRLRVSNTGNADARSVKVQVAAGNQPNSQVVVGDLAAGQSEVVEMDLTFEKAGQVQIAAIGSAEGNLQRATSINVSVRQPILSAKLSLPESAPLGSLLVAQVELSNTGDAPARQLQAGMALPPGTETPQLPAGVRRDGDKLLWDVEQLPPGQMINLPIEIRLAAPGEQELSLACVLADGTSATTHAQVTMEAFADLKLVVNDPIAPAPVGASVTYELIITNRGSRDAKAVTIVAQFSDGIEPESATGWKHQVVPGQVRFETLPQIAAGQSVQLKVVARAAQAGVHRFRAEVRCDDSEARLVEEESTRFMDSTGRIASPPSPSIQR